LAASYGIKEKDIFLERENTLASFIERTRAYLSVRHQGKDSPLPEDIIKDMNTLKVELAIPLILHNKMIGILTLGKKKSDEDYTQDDIDILLPLSRTLAIAISNAELFDELSKTQAEAAQREKMAVIGTLSAGINHEICNPLGIVRGQCEAFMLNLKEGLYKDKSEEEIINCFDDAEVIHAGSSLKFCRVAEGAADIYIRSGPTMEWDTAAGQSIAECAGAWMCDLGGRPFKYNKKSLRNPGFLCGSLRGSILAKVRAMARPFPRGLDAPLTNAILPSNGILPSFLIDLALSA